MGIQRVLILRPDNLGDVVLFSGALRHLRALYPDARITFVGKRYALPLLEHCPFVDDLRAWESIEEALPGPRYRPPGEGWWARRVRYARRRRDRREWRRFCEGLACDLLLLPVRSPTARMHEVVSAIPAERKIGIAGDTENQTPEDDEAAEAIYSGRMPLPPDRRFAPEQESTAEFLAFLGARVAIADVWPEFWTTADDRAWAAEAVPRGPGALLLGVAPGRTEIQRLYAPERYAEALLGLEARRPGVVLLGAKGESALCTRVLRALEERGFRGEILDLCGRTTPRQLVEAIRRLDVIVSLDSPVVHIAAACEKPVVGIRGGGHVGRFWPWGDARRSRLAAEVMDCYGCNWICVHDRVRCVEDVPVQTLRSEIEAAIACLPATFEA